MTNEEHKIWLEERNRASKRHRAKIYYEANRDKLIAYQREYRIRTQKPRVSKPPKPVRVVAPKKPIIALLEQKKYLIDTIYATQPYGVTIAQHMQQWQDMEDTTKVQMIQAAMGQKFTGHPIPNRTLVQWRKQLQEMGLFDPHVA